MRSTVDDDYAKRDLSQMLISPAPLTIKDLKNISLIFAGCINNKTTGQ